MPFVFGTFAHAAPLIGTAPPEELEHALHGAWVRFAATGDPGWPRYRTDRRAVMEFGANAGVIDDPDAARRAAWQPVVESWR